MNTRRLGVAVAVLGGFLYAVGGSDGQMPLNTGLSVKLTEANCLLVSEITDLFLLLVERYDPRHNKWTLN